MEENIYQANIVTCPHCSKTFDNHMVNGLALQQAVSSIDARKRMYCKLSLDDLERLTRAGTIGFPEAKKIVLDNFNDFVRDINTILGWGLEAE
jgi:hypothetical protein